MSESRLSYEQLLLSELRLVPYQSGSSDAQGSLVKAMTVNEELLSLGFRFSAEDIVRLADSPSLDGIVEQIRQSIGDVKAQPMYPGFPDQVMAMDEAVFRFHQLLHYASTYGIEWISGTPVTKGWLPEGECIRDIPDEHVLAAKVIALVDTEQMYAVPFRTILSRKERMTDKEQLIIRECVSHLPTDVIAGAQVPFKQNLLWLFYAVFSDEKLTAQEKLPALHGLCQHTGDVWKCFDFVLTRERYHLRTSQKRLMVKLFESYPVSDFTENLILSNRKRERTLLLLKYLDYNEYSRSPQHHQAVADLRSDQLRSWESRAKYLVEQHSEHALDYIAERPGMLLRWVTYLLRNSYAASEIGQCLCGHAGSLKIQTVVSVLTHFAQLAEDVPENREAAAVSAIMREVLRECLTGIETPLRVKKVFLDFTGFDPAHSTLLTVGKSAEGGYIRSGLSYTIPEDVKRLRFFVYWNDQRRVDVDLHGTAVKRDGREVRIGWNADFRDESLAFSGDITHSDAAEYIDVDLDNASKELSYVKTTIDLYYGYPTFREVDVCYVGCMAVKNIGEEVQLYDPANCFFTHFLTGGYRSIGYGFIDITHRCITFVGNQTKNWYDTAHPGSAFSLADYLELLLSVQNAQIVDTPDEADHILVIGKPFTEKEISLIDHNFFMDG